jgi:hypothetical protein
MTPGGNWDVSPDMLRIGCAALPDLSSFDLVNLYTMDKPDKHGFV